MSNQAINDYKKVLDALTIEARTNPAIKQALDDAFKGVFTPPPTFTQPPTNNQGCPPLPDYATLPDDLGNDACKWLDDYVKFSRFWANRSFDGYHEANGLWVLSTIAARRVKTEFGGSRYPSLYVLLAGRSSLYTKTTAAKIAIEVLEAAGLRWILAPNHTTPQAFISLLAAHLPDDYDNLPQDQQDKIKKRLGLEGARGWFHEEFGSHVNAMMQPGGFMAEFRGLLREFDDGYNQYESATIGRGVDAVNNPYLALLGNITPADLRKFAKKGSELWGDGFLARFAIVSPAAGEKRKDDIYPAGEKVIPAELITPLQTWHKRLGEARVDLQPINTNGNNKKQNGNAQRYKPLILPPQVQTIPLSKDARDRLDKYGKGLKDIMEAENNEDLDGNYSRFPEKALRIATLLASLSGAKEIGINHWARAQAITERWRAGIHALYETINSDQSLARQNEENILQRLNKFISDKGKNPTANDLKPYIRNLSTPEIQSILESLVDTGQLVAFDQKGGRNKGTKRYGFPTQNTP